MGYYKRNNPKSFAAAGSKNIILAGFPITDQIAKKLEKSGSRSTYSNE
jgi:hypothetical protein